MAEVIGFDNNAKSRITCKSSGSKHGCGAIIEYDQRDVKVYSGTDWSGGSDGREWVVCPNCQKELTIRSW